MRKIRFRAWPKDGESGFDEMLKVCQVDFCGESLIDHTYPYIIDQDTAMHKLEDVILMQFTGLTDKNGDEIYEGDIVVLEGPSHSKNRKSAREVLAKGVVKWDEKNGRFSVEEVPLTQKGFKLYDRHFYKNPWHELEQDFEWQELKVIGNVYQHAHLLD